MQSFNKFQSLYRTIRSYNQTKRDIIKAFSQSREIYNFNEMIRKGVFFSNRIEKWSSDKKAPYPVLVAGGSGLVVMDGKLVINLLRPKMGCYIFGIACSNMRIYLSLSYHMQIKSDLLECKNNRISMIISADISDIRSVINGSSTEIGWSTEEIAMDKSYSYINIYKNQFFASDYLGSISIFRISDSGHLCNPREELSLVRFITDEDAYFYPFMHLNSVSVDSRKIYVGSHSYTKVTGAYGKIYSIDRENGNISVNEKLGFVSAHDMINVSDVFYGCNSGKGELYKGEKCIFHFDAFLRGLSINDAGYVVGATQKTSVRNKRYKKSNLNKVIFLDHDASVMEEITPMVSAIYRIFAIENCEYSQSSPIKIID